MGPMNCTMIVLPHSVYNGRGAQSRTGHEPAILCGLWRLADTSVANTLANTGEYCTKISTFGSSTRTARHV